MIFMIIYLRPAGFPDVFSRGILEFWNFFLGGVRRMHYLCGKIKNKLLWY